MICHPVENERGVMGEIIKMRLNFFLEDPAGVSRLPYMHISAKPS
jgi:hypothetical protein